MGDKRYDVYDNKSKSAENGSGLIAQCLNIDALLLLILGFSKIPNYMDLTIKESERAVADD